MKKIIILLGLFVSFESLANCSVPKSLSGKTFINVADEDYSIQNPNAGSIVKLNYTTDDSYNATILQKNISFSGNYKYKRLNKKVGFLKVNEEFGGQITKYTFVLNCLNDNSGTFVFTQTQGAIKPDNRQNTGTYTFSETY